MKILFISLFLPRKTASHAGGRHVFWLLQSLAQRHEIHLVTRLEQGEEPYLQELENICTTVTTYSYPAVEKRNAVESMRLAANYLGFSRFADRFIRQQSFDLIQVEWVETGLFIFRHGAPMVLDAHDVITKPAERRAAAATGISRVLAWLVWQVVKRLEQAIVRRYDCVTTLSEFDRSYMRSLSPQVPVSVVPVPAGLDISSKQYAVRPRTLLFFASYKHRFVNVAAALWFHHEVLPLVRQTCADARFVIAGYGPPEALTGLATADPLTEVTGFVDDMDRCYKEAEIFVAPIRTGGGIIVKVLDALAAGRPVVTTTFGNEGVGATPGEHLLVADTPADFAAAVVYLLLHPEQAHALGAKGQEFVRLRYGQETIIRQVEETYQKLANKRCSGKTEEL